MSYASGMQTAVVSERPPLLAWQVWLGGIASLILTVGMARFAYTPMLPVMQTQVDLSITAGGWLATLNYIGYLVGALLVARIESPRLRHRLYGAGLWLAVVGTVGMAFSEHVAWWALVRFAGGVSGAAGMLLGTGLVLNWLMKSGKRAELGAHFMGVGLGIVVSALAAAWFQSQDLTWSNRWLGFGLIALLCALAAWRWRPPVPDTVSTQSHQSSAPRPCVVARSICFCSALVMVCFRVVD